MRFNKKTIAWIIACLAVNLFFFLPGYILYLGEDSFLPSTTLADGASLGKFSHLFVRDNQDIFRLSIDWFVIAALLFFIRKRWPAKILFWAGWLWFSVLVIYQLYFQFSLKVYGEIPNFKNDWVLIQEVLPIFLDQFSSGNKSLIYAGVALGLVLLLTMIFFLIRWYVRKAHAVPVKRSNILGLVVIGVVLAAFSFKNSRSNYPANFNMAQWTAAPLIQSFKAKNSTQKKLMRRGQRYEDYFALQLDYKPNIYLLFVESYGELLYQQEELQSSYFSLLEEVEGRLTQEGFQTRSVLSDAPIIGGRSWLAFTSAMCGQRIPDQLTFNEMLKLHDYPHLIHFMNHQGYETIRIKSMADYHAHIKADYSETTSFYCFDNWLKYHNFPYKGYKYDWFGGLPDQYVLNYFEEKIPKDTTKPLFTFFINMNSHGPWFPTPPILDDWQKLDTIAEAVTIDFDSMISTAPIRQRYSNSIDYQLKYLTQFILKNGAEDDIFLLIGDHQPALIHRPGVDGNLTPFHVIAKDSTFVDHFERYGFQTGMKVDASKSDAVRHADFYAMLVEALLAIQPKTAAPTN